MTVVAWVATAAGFVFWFRVWTGRPVSASLFGVYVAAVTVRVSSLVVEGEAGWAVVVAVWVLLWAWLVYEIQKLAP